MDTMDAIDDEIRIAVIETVKGCRAHQQLQDLIWGHQADGAVPAEFMIALARNGGLVLGAYAGDQMVGLALGVPALKDGKLIHLSHLLGVHPDWRGRGIGERLKWRQRELVLAQGITTITWTFNPLEAVNARLNLTRLGGIVRTYVRDYYGAMEDALNRGIPTDRFVLEWLLTSRRVQERARGVIPPAPDANAPVALGSTIGSAGLREPATFVGPSGPLALVEVPADLQGMKRQSLDVALAWRLATRDAFERLFAAGFVGTGVIRRDGRVFYAVERDFHED
jgi:predicted GNAT superfamily acetyltransferase